MQFKIDVDCSPEEARTFLGLPDLKPIHDRYVQVWLDSMNAGASLEQMESMFRNLSPIGDAGMKLFSDMMNLGIGAAGAGTGRKS